jgi:hypothetical protein
MFYLLLTFSVVTSLIVENVLKNIRFTNNLFCLKIAGLSYRHVCGCAQAYVLKTAEFWYLGKCGHRSLRTVMWNYAFLLNKLHLGVCFKDRWEHICHSLILLCEVGQYAETIFRYTTIRTVMNCPIVLMNLEVSSSLRHHMPDKNEGLLN